MMQGWILFARVNSACTSFWVSPNHLLCSLLAVTLMKLHPDSAARACMVKTQGSANPKRQEKLQASIAAFCKGKSSLGSDSGIAGSK